MFAIDDPLHVLIVCSQLDYSKRRLESPALHHYHSCIELVGQLLQRKTQERFRVLCEYSILANGSKRKLKPCPLIRERCSVTVLIQSTLVAAEATVHRRTRE